MRHFDYGAIKIMQQLMNWQEVHYKYRSCFVSVVGPCSVAKRLSYMSETLVLENTDQNILV